MGGCGWNDFRLTLRSSLRLWTISDDAHEFRVGTKLSVDLGFTAHALDARAEPQSCYLEHQTISRDDGPAKARLFNAGEEHELLIAIFDFSQRENRTALREGLDHEDPRHPGGAGKVSLEQ